MKVRCGISDCPFSSRTFGDTYDLVSQHFVARHDLNPDLNEGPGLKIASFFVDLSNGSIEVRMSLTEGRELSKNG